MKERSYKIKIDKVLLKQFFVSDPDEACLNEVNKVISLVLAKYYSKHYMWFDELRQIGMYAITIRRAQFNPELDAYNYIYTVFRNEIGNKIISMTKEVSMTDFITHQNKVYDTIEAELPQEICRYKDYFTGEKEFTMERIPNKEVIPVIYFARKFDSIRCKVPSFIQNDPENVCILYKMLKDLTNG